MKKMDKFRLEQTTIEKIQKIFSQKNQETDFLFKVWCKKKIYQTTCIV